MTQTIEHHRRTGSIVRLCCLTSWPRHRPNVPAFYKWAPPSRCCGNVAGSVLLGAAVFPWAVVKGVLVAVPAAMFGFVGSILLIPTSLARTTVCLGAGVVSSSTMSWKKRLLCVPIVIVMVVLWAPVSLVLLALVTVLASIVGVILAFNATYIAAFYKAVNDMDDPMDFWVPNGFIGRAMFGILETFEHMVNVAELYMLGYLDYLEPLVLHWADPKSCKKPVKHIAQPKMIIATRGTQEGRGDRKLSTRVTVDQAFVAATTSNVLFNDDVSVDLSQSMEEPIHHQTVNEAHYHHTSGRIGLTNNPLAFTEASDATMEAPAPLLSEWSLIRSETELHAQAFDNRAAAHHHHASEEGCGDGADHPEDATDVKIMVEVDAIHASSSANAAQPASPSAAAAGGVGQQRGYGEWGIGRSKTFGPCDGRLGTVVRPVMTSVSAADEFPLPAPRPDGYSNECVCTAQISPGHLVVTVLHDVHDPKDRTDARSIKLWRFCPNPACIHSCPAGSRLPPLPEVLPIDRFARVTVFEQLQLEQAGIMSRCT